MEAVQDYLTCDGFDAWIVVDGVKTPQYGVEHKEGEHKVSCWISSETGKEFSLSFCQKGEAHHYTATIELDGHKVAYDLYRNTDTQPNSFTKTISTVRTSLMEGRKFAFASLELTDDDIHLEDPSSQNIGEIKVTIQQVKNAVLTNICAAPTYAVPNKAGKVHERSKKGLAHQIKFGSAEKLPSLPRIPHYRVQCHGEPITFIFKYRPIAMLQATGIVPPPLEKESPHRSAPPPNGTNNSKASDVKIEINDDDESEEEDEDEDDLAKERELLAELERVRNRKRARKEGNAHSKKKIKTEPKTYFTPGEVIDLT